MYAMMNCGGITMCLPRQHLPQGSKYGASIKKAHWARDAWRCNTHGQTQFMAGQYIASSLGTTIPVICMWQSAPLWS